MTALTPKGRVFTDLLVEVFRLRALLLESSERIAGGAGLTTARWLVLGAVEHAPATVAQVARRLGLTRQSVQETADAMGRAGLVEFVENPEHRRSRLMTPTAAARDALDALRPREQQFANLMGSPHSLAALRSTLGVLRASRAAIEAGQGSQTR